eukprot:2303753-Prymnesium_polylepis.1
MASQEYAILEEFPELNNVKVSDYAELDNVYHYDPFEAVDTEAMIVRILTAEYMMNAELSTNGKRGISEINRINVENTTNNSRRRNRNRASCQFRLEAAGERPRWQATALRVHRSQRGPGHVDEKSYGRHSPERVDQRHCRRVRA